MFASVIKDYLYLLSLVTTLERVQVGDGEYLTSTTEKMESIIDERQIREDQISHAPGNPLTITEGDDWFVLLDVIPRGTPYVQPGIAKISLYGFKMAFPYLVLCPFKNCFSLYQLS